MNSSNETIKVEVTDPLKIHISKKVTEVLHFVTKKSEEFNKKDLSEEEKQKLNDAIFEPSIRVSLGIEGIEIRKGDTVEAEKIRKIYTEIKHSETQQATINLLDAVDLIRARINDNLSLDFLKKLHYEVGKNIYPDAGYLRIDGRAPTGSRLETPPHFALENMIDDMSVFFEYCDNSDDDSVHPIVLSAWLHNTFTKLHPFTDGNGRTARLLQDWVLIKHGYFPVSSGSLRRERYLDLLEEADEGDWTEFVSSLAEAQSDVIARANQTVNASERSRENLDSIIKAVTGKRTTALSEEYQNWRHHMERILSSFENVCNHLNERAPNREVFVRMIRNDIIEQSKWEIIREEGTDLQNNAFLIYWNHQDHEFYKSIGYYARHFKRKNTDPTFRKKEINKSVSLYLGGHDLPPEKDFPRKAIPIKTPEGKMWAELPFQDSRIKTRELLIGEEGNILRYKNVPQGEELDLDNTSITLSEREHETWIYDEAMPDEIASEYAKEVFTKTNTSS